MFKVIAEGTFFCAVVFRHELLTEAEDMARHLVGQPVEGTYPGVVLADGTPAQFFSDRIDKTRVESEDGVVLSRFDEPAFQTIAINSIKV